MIKTLKSLKYSNSEMISYFHLVLKQLDSAKRMQKSIFKKVDAIFKSFNLVPITSSTTNSIKPIPESISQNLLERVSQDSLDSIKFTPLLVKDCDLCVGYLTTPLFEDPSPLEPKKVLPNNSFTSEQETTYQRHKTLEESLQDPQY